MKKFLGAKKAKESAFWSNQTVIKVVNAQAIVRSTKKGKSRMIRDMVSLTGYPVYDSKKGNVVFSNGVTIPLWRE